MQSLRPLLPEMVELFSMAVLSTQSNKLVKAATSALFNVSKLCFEESSSIGDDEIISIIVALVESIKNLKGGKKEGDLQRLLTVCVGGYVTLGRESEGVKEILAGIDAVDVLKRIDGSIAEEVIGFIEAL